MPTPPVPRSGLPYLAAACLAFALAAPADARPAYKQALADYLGPLLAKKLHDCQTCHVAATGDEPARDHNPFGARVKAVRKERKAAGEPTDLDAVLDAILDEDADGDGVANVAELLAGRLPGDPADTPTADEVTAAVAKRPAFARSRAGYPWRPFAPVKRPAVPASAWGRNPIDAFIAAGHAEHGLTPSPEAPRHVLVRRLYLDLVGLPPTPAELTAALADPSPAWYDALVDRLLADPRHGERWGRHWMDVWRYSDWYGYNAEVRHSQPHVWRWRDWLVESLNADKGYDRLVVEMLAGDEAAPGDEATARATGYLVRGYDRLSRERWLQDTVEHAFQGFLGVTIGCARCHDHMYDPITHREYFQARAFFEPHQVRIDHVPGEANPLKNGLARAFDAAPDAPTYFLKRGDPALADKGASLPPAVPAALGGRPVEIVPVPLPPSDHDPENRPFVIAELIAAAEKEVTRVKDARAKADVPDPKLTPEKQAAAVENATLDVALMEARLDALTATHRADQLAAGSAEWQAAATAATTAQRRQAVAEAKKKFFTVEQQRLSAVTESQKTYYAGQAGAAARVLATAEEAARKPATTDYAKRPVKTYPATSTGRRLALARWIADGENPLTARVAMNHVWLRHFGQALAPSVADLGRNGRPPTHPALLDWLAAEFVERGWSLKAMHRLLVTSATYRQAATPHAANAERDRDNAYYWRLPSRRMEAEVVRDSVLHVAGRLDPAMGGPDLPHEQGLFVHRRSLYFRHAEDQQMEFLKLFDAPSVIECYQRPTSVSPQQALALANSDLTVRAARAVARGIVARQGKAPAAFVDAAFAAVLSRPPTDDERAGCVAFLADQAKLYGPPRTPPATAVDDRQPSPDPDVRAAENLVRVLFNHHDFLTIR